MSKKSSFLKFNKSSSSQHGERCVEVAFTKDAVYVRNSKALEPVVKFTPDEWLAFIEGAKKNEFDLTP